MAYAKQKNPSIQWIFEVYNEGPKRYSDSALLYQYILGFAIKLNNKFPANGIYESFTIWELTDWLINNYYKYQNELKDIPFKNMSRTNRIAAKLDGVRNKVESLKTLDLIEEKGLTKASRGDKETMSLSFTNSGYLLAWIIEGLQEKKRKASNIQICNVLEYNYKDRPSSFDFFALLLTEKFKEQGLFDELVANALRDRVADPRWNINTMLELVYSLSIPDKRNGKLFYEIWIQTLNELDVSQKKIVMQYVKLNIGRLIEMDLKYPKGYEELRYRLRDKPNLLAVEGVCNNRRSTHLCPLTMNLIDYIKIDKSPYTPSGMTCPRCGSSNTLSITLPYY